MLFNVFYVVNLYVLSGCQRMSREIVIMSQLTSCILNTHLYVHIGLKLCYVKNSVKLPFIHAVDVLTLLLLLFFLADAGAHILCAFRLKEFERDYYHVKIHRRFFFAFFYSIHPSIPWHATSLNHHFFSHASVLN